MTLDDAALTRAEYDACLRVPFCPQTPTPAQRRFLRLKTREGGFGGAAGPGKSSALIMSSLRYVEHPNYHALLLRQSYQDLALPGALMDRAAEWLQPTGARWSERDKRWRFPAGASLSFGYMETSNDRYRYQSTEFDFIGWDELTQFDEVEYRYLFSRIARTPKPFPSRMRFATNPGGRGHKWVKKRFGLDGAGKQSSRWTDDEGRVITATERPFIPARMDDNPHLDRAAYEASLSELDATTRDQLARGLWVLDDSQRIYRYDPDAHQVGALPDHYADGRWLDETMWRRILAIDLGASVSSRTTGFVELAWHPHVAATFVERSWCEAGMIPSTLADLVQKRVAAHPDLVVVIDEGALGHGYGEEMRRRYSLPVYAAEKRDKAPARRLLNGAFERGELLLLTGQCVDLEDELTTLLWDKAGRDAAPGLADHCSDALLYGWRMSRSWTSTQAPAKPPTYGSPEWHEAQRREHEARERASLQQSEQLEDFERW